MVHNCVSVDCKNRDEKDARASGLTFHRFPLTRPALLQKWLSNMKRKEPDGRPWQPTTASRICSVHFTADSFHAPGLRVRLRPDAVPTRFHFPYGQLQLNMAHEELFPEMSNPVKTEIENLNMAHEELSQEMSNPVKTEIEDLNMAHEALSLEMGNPIRTEIGDSAVLKLEPLWSMREELKDLPSPVDGSAAQPLSDKTCESLLSVNRSHECRLCSSAFVLFSCLELHLASVHGEKVHTVLPECGSPGDCDSMNVKNEVGDSSGRKVGERMRGEKDGEKRNRWHKPETCGKGFTEADCLERRKKSHTRRKTLVRRPYSEAFTQADRSKTHKRTHTGQKPFLCDVCGEAFAQCASLNSHKLIHTKRKHMCDLCSKLFARAAYLKIHKRFHTGERPFKCFLCDSGFYQSSTLRRHIRSVHAGNRPYLCDVCGLAFSEASGLKVHKRIHTGEKPYICPDCGKGFVGSSGLKKHEVTHTGEKLYSCPLCSDVAFSLAGSLKRHMKKAHP